MSRLARARAAGYVPKGELNVEYDGVKWHGPEGRRYARIDGVQFIAEKQGPGCWRLIAKRFGAEVLRKLCPDLNAAKKQAAIFMRQR